MNGWSYDYMLALDDDNCKKRSDARKDKTITDSIATAITDAKKLDANIGTYFDKDGAMTFCEYISWAYLESIELSSDIDVEKFYTVCNSL